MGARGECHKHGLFNLKESDIVVYFPDKDEKSLNSHVLHGGVVLLLYCPFKNCKSVLTKFPSSSLFSIPVLEWSQSSTSKYTSSYDASLEPSEPYETSPGDS